MTPEEDDFCDLAKPTHIRERLADLTGHEAEVFAGMVGDLLRGCTTRRLDRLRVLFEELSAIATEDATRRALEAGDEIDALRALAALE